MEGRHQRQAKSRSNLHNLCATGAEMCVNQRDLLLPNERREFGVAARQEESQLLHSTKRPGAKREVREIINRRPANPLPAGQNRPVSPQTHRMFANIVLHRREQMRRVNQHTGARVQTFCTRR